MFLPILAQRSVTCHSFLSIPNGLMLGETMNEVIKYTCSQPHFEPRTCRVWNFGTIQLISGTYSSTLWVVHQQCVG